ncbi:hypothetical protein L916_16751 [Phytophthora nicotianae]|uniref:Uncharacterized protein n=1 Tax=Phytophthora nicotianae TaxID=4792 RepID=W2I9U1_PHYNI|nr:hypothetical protein L916_16751 [Phytophthora nicotianae]
MTWWYAYHGRIAFDGKSWPAYFGAVFTSEGRYINIGQGDRTKVVDASGKIMASKYSFDWATPTTYANRTAICKTHSNLRTRPGGVEPGHRVGLTCVEQEVLDPGEKP